MATTEDRSATSSPSSSPMATTEDRSVTKSSSPMATTEDRSVEHGSFRGAVYKSGSAAQHYAATLFFGGLDFKDKVVLDCGCGDGGALMAILGKAQPKKVYAFDASESQIATAQRLETKVDWFVATFDNFLEVRPELLGQVDIVISNYALHFASSLQKTFADFATALKPEGTLCAMWPIHKNFMGPVVRAAKKDERYAALIGDFPVEDRHPNGVVIPGQKTSHFLRTAFDALQGWDRQHVGKIFGVAPCGTRENVRKFLAGINPVRFLIPEELIPEFDDFCVTEILKQENSWDGFSLISQAIQVRARLRK